MSIRKKLIMKQFSEQEAVKYVRNHLVKLLNEDHTEQNAEFPFFVQPYNCWICSTMYDAVNVLPCTLNKVNKYIVNNVCYDLYHQLNINDNQKLTRTTIQKMIWYCDQKLNRPVPAFQSRICKQKFATNNAIEFQYA